MDIGKLNKRITVVTPGTLTPDGIGGFIEGTPVSVDVWAKADQISQRDQLSYGLEVGTASWNFIFREITGANFSQSKSLIYKGKKYRIISIVDIGEGFLKVTANVQTN